MATPSETTVIPPQLPSNHDTSYIPRGPVTAELKFYAAPTDGSKPFDYPNEPPAGLPKRNFGDADTAVTIKDIRGQESLYKIDDNAFEALKTGRPPTHIDFTSEASIKEKYYPEISRLLQEHIPGAKRVLPFDHIVRPSGGNRPPVLRAHIDQSKGAAIGRVHHFLPDEAEELLKGRVRIINVWRPLNGPVQCTPLAFADSQTVDGEALVAVKHRYAERVGETLSVKHMDGQQWYYWSGMENDERLLLVCYDSERGVRVPHSAFVDSRSPEGARARESVEVRSLVFE